MELRSYGHPSLLRALKELRKYSEYIEKNSPITKRGGIFFFSSLGLSRPEVVRYNKRLRRYTPPAKAKVLLLLPQTKKKPFHSSVEHSTLMNKIKNTLKDKTDLVHFCTYSAPFGVVPSELEEVYPLSQNEITFPLDLETINYVAEKVANYVVETNYNQVILLKDPLIWKGKVAAACKRSCKKKKIIFKVSRKRDPWSTTTTNDIVLILEGALKSLEN